MNCVKYMSTQTRFLRENKSVSIYGFWDKFWTQIFICENLHYATLLYLIVLKTASQMHVAPRIKMFNGTCTGCQKQQFAPARKSSWKGKRVSRERERGLREAEHGDTGWCGPSTRGGGRRAVIPIKLWLVSTPAGVALLFIFSLFSLFRLWLAHSLCHYHVLVSPQRY